MVVKVDKSAMIQNWSNRIFNEFKYDIGPEHMDKLFDVVFTASANALNMIKKKDAKTAFTFTNTDKSLIAAAICEYFPNEDASKPGNWSLVWTFDESDLVDVKENNKIDIADIRSHEFFRGVAGNKWGMIFEDPGSMIVTINSVLVDLKKFLDENATADDTFTVEQDGIFQARVAVEDGAKVFAVEPAGEIKILIKDDTAIEK